MRIRRSSFTTSRSRSNVVPVDAQRRHAIGFEPERQRQVLRRHRLPEHRDVLGGVRVGLPADAGRSSDVCCSGSTFFEPLNIRCSNRWANPVRPAPLVLRADVVPHLDVDDRRRVVLVQDDAEPVRQRRGRVLELRRPDARRGADAARQGDRQRQQQGPGDDTPGRPAAGPVAQVRFGACHPADYGTSYRRAGVSRTRRQRVDSTRGEALLQVRQGLLHLRQAPEHGRRLQPVAIVDGRVARDERAVGHRVRDAGLRRGPRALPDVQVPRHADLAGQHRRVADRRAARRCRPARRASRCARRGRRAPPARGCRSSCPPGSASRPPPGDRWSCWRRSRRRPR